MTELVKERGVLQQDLLPQAPPDNVSTNRVPIYNAGSDHGGDSHSCWEESILHAMEMLQNYV